MLKLLSKLSIIAICATLFFGCASVESENSDVVYMSAILPFNDSPEVAAEMYKAMTMAVDKVNASRDRMAGKELKLDIRSDGKGIYETSQIMQSMLDSKINILHIAVRAPVIFKQESLAESDKFINYLNDYAPATLIGKNSVRTFLSTVQSCESLADVLSEKFSQVDAAKVFVLCLDDLVSRSNAEYLKFELAKQNAKDIFFKKGESNFDLFAEHIQNLDLEYIFIVSLGEENDDILRALKKFNYKGKVLSFCASKPKKAGLVSDLDTVGYFYTKPYFDEPNQRAKQSESSAFYDDYKELFGAYPTHKAAYAYDSIILSAYAYNESPKNMREAFFNKKFEGAIGEIEFDATGDSKVKMIQAHHEPSGFRGCILPIGSAVE